MPFSEVSIWSSRLMWWKEGPISIHSPLLLFCFVCSVVWWGRDTVLLAEMKMPCLLWTRLIKVIAFQWLLCSTDLQCKLIRGKREMLSWKLMSEVSFLPFPLYMGKHYLLSLALHLLSGAPGLHGTILIPTG